MKTQHTPGPWKHSTGTNLEGIEHRWISADGSFIADLGIVDGPCDNEANARLIAAAPELLAALRDGLDYMVDPAQFGITGTRVVAEFIEAARAAIAKANG